MLKFKLEVTSISSTVHVRRPDNVGGWRCIFKQVAETIGLLKTLDFVNFGGFCGFRFLDPPPLPGHFNVTCCIWCLCWNVTDWEIIDQKFYPLGGPLPRRIGGSEFSPMFNNVNLPDCDDKLSDMLTSWLKVHDIFFTDFQFFMHTTHSQ